MRHSLATILLVLSATTACSAPAHPASPQGGVPAIAWPPSPARPRIRFVNVVARPADLGIRLSLWRRLGEVIGGAHEEWLVRPTGVAARDGVLYVADPGAQSIWMLDGEHGRFRKTHVAGPNTLVSPVAVATGRGDRVYVVDSFLAKMFAFDHTLRLERTIAAPDFVRPAGIAVDDEHDRLYVADSGAHKIWIYTAGGARLGAIGRRGTGEGEFNFPTHVAVDRAGTVYVTDSLGFRVQMFDPTGRFTGAFGRHGDSSGDFAAPKGVAVDSERHVYVVDALFDAVQIFDRRGRFLLGFGARGIAPGEFWLPAGAYIDEHDRIYVADAYNQRIQIFQYLAGGPDE